MVIRSRKSKNRYSGDLEVRSRKSEDRQYNGQKKKDKRTNNNIQNIIKYTKNRATRIPLKLGGELRYSRTVRSFCSTSATRCVTLVTNPMICHE